MKNGAVWTLIASLVVVALVFGMLSEVQRVADANQRATTALANEASDRLANLCATTIRARKEINRQNAALRTYLHTVLTINGRVRKIQPVPAKLAPYERRNLAALHVLLHSLAPLPIPKCSG